MQDVDILESRDLRDELSNRVEVLDKVKKLLMYPELDFMTIQQVADYYEVDYDAIKSVIRRNRDELTEDGLRMGNYKEFLKGQDDTLKKLQGKVIVYLNNEEVTIPNRGLYIFPRRAILRVGMLLRDSDIAKEVRTQLLNIEEKATVETKIEDITTEEKLMLEIGKGVANGDAIEVARASAALMEFKNRHIQKLEDTNKALANGILTWEDRSQINFAMRKLAQYANVNYGKLWNEFYKHLKYKYHIDLKLRGNKPWIQYMRKEEWDSVGKTFSALCMSYGVDPNEMVPQLKIVQ